MAYLCSLLLIALLTVASGATPLYCSDVQSPADGSGHNTGLSHVTTLQYCIIDNCTIMRTDTGQQLDIVYTTESLLIVTLKDDHTFMVIAKTVDELPCLGYPSTTIHSKAVTQLIMSVYILIVQLLFKNLMLCLESCSSFTILAWYHYTYASLDTSIFTNNIPHYYGNICISTCRLRIIHNGDVELLAYIMYW